MVEVYVNIGSFCKMRSMSDFQTNQQKKDKTRLDFIRIAQGENNPIS